MSRPTLDTAMSGCISSTGLSPSLAGFPKTVPLYALNQLCSPNPGLHAIRGLPSSAFARRYLRNRSFFLFLALLRCFSSGGSPPYAMDSHMDARALPVRVSPFRDPRIVAYMRLPVAFRSLSRLSSALSAKASTLRSSLLDLRSLMPLRSVGVA